MSGVNYVVGINNSRFTSLESITIREVRALRLVSPGRSGGG